MALGWESRGAGYALSGSEDRRGEGADGQERGYSSWKKVEVTFDLSGAQVMGFLGFSRRGLQHHQRLIWGALPAQARQGGDTGSAAPCEEEVKVYGASGEP